LSLATGPTWANGKTINAKLSPEAAPVYRAAALQYRKLKVVLRRLEKLSQTILPQQAKLAQSQHYELTQKPGLFQYPGSQPSPPADRSILITDFTLPSF
jgi:hypothetical protein